MPAGEGRTRRSRCTSRHDPMTVSWVTDELASSTPCTAPEEDVLVHDASESWAGCPNPIGIDRRFRTDDRLEQHADALLEVTIFVGDLSYAAKHPFHDISKIDYAPELHEPTSPNLLPVVEYRPISPYSASSPTPKKSRTRILRPPAAAAVAAAMALSSSSALLQRLLRSSTPSRSSILRATLCSSSGPSPTPPLPSSIFGDDTEVANLPPLTTPKLFVSGLSRLTTDEKLKGAFDPFGKVLEAKVVTDRISGRSKGFGFVRYATIEQAEEARQKMNAKFLDGWVIFVDPAKPRQPNPPPQQDTRSSHTGFTTNKTVGWCG
ncbi:hypothetical protein PR202_ga26168 [Eleusine coracana subsp. coracana]|uniref:RRM domain-containing protein n=1 Tax=Eleusine coracana subsp. coracana TaxID=191504 RepID=A0AAV5DDQ9_ELECO|nr:hypothetical protein PR202_ga26168 [Eleusine coracana subsp. coracana]